MDLETASRAACKAAAQIDAQIEAKLIKRARKQGIANEGDAIALIEAWKQAAKRTKRLRISNKGRRKGHGS